MPYSYLSPLSYKGIESMRALPALLFSGETMICLVSFNVQQVQRDV
jgi:hypothetical protein